MVFGQGEVQPVVLNVKGAPVGSTPDPADEESRKATTYSGCAWDKAWASRGARDCTSSSLNTVIGLLPSTGRFDKP